MNILVTGAKGFVGKNLCAALYNLKDGKDKTRSTLCIENVYEYDVDNSPADLDKFCASADFVFHLAGVNRPKTQEEFMQGNFGFTSLLLDVLKKHNNKCPVMLSSSIQASLIGRYAGGEYGKSKKAGEELMFEYGRETGSKVLVYRFPNLFGKWCRPNYNSAVATFCHNIAHDLPIQVNDRSVEMELLYIDDLVDEMIDALASKEHRCTYNGLDPVPCACHSERSEDELLRTSSEKSHIYCYCPITHKATLGEIVDMIYSFADQPKTLLIPEIPEGSLAKKLYSTYLSYLPKEKISFPLKMNVDPRGSFTELIHTLNCGQISINISKPGITKGQHWHHTKWEFFIVVSGHGLIQQRKVDSNEILNFEVSGDKIEVIHMLPGYTHNIINLSDTENLVTVMYCNEIFNTEKPDTYFEPVE